MKVAKLFAYLAIALLLPLWLYSLTSYDIQNKEKDDQTKDISIEVDKSLVDAISRSEMEKPPVVVSPNDKLVEAIEKMNAANANNFALLGNLLNKDRNITVSIPKITFEQKSDNPNIDIQNTLSKMDKKMDDIQTKINPAYLSNATIPTKAISVIDSFPTINIYKDRTIKPFVIKIKKDQLEKTHFFGIRNNSSSTLTIISVIPETQDATQLSKNKGKINIEKGMSILGNQIKLFDYKFIKGNDDVLYSITAKYEPCPDEIPFQIVIERN